LEIFLWNCVYCTLKCMVMNSIRDIDGRNGKSGGIVLFTGLGLKSGVCDCGMGDLCLDINMNI